MSRYGRRALVAARGLLGIVEHGGNNRGAEVERIISATHGRPGEPWCGYFVAYCYRISGSRAVTREWASVRRLGLLSGMRFVRKPAVGDIVTFTFDHTGLVVSVCNASGRPCAWRKATHVKTIEGNTGRVGAVSDSTTGGDGVYMKVRPLGSVAHWVRVYR